MQKCINIFLKVQSKKNFKFIQENITFIYKKNIFELKYQTTSSNSKTKIFKLQCPTKHLQFQSPPKNLQISIQKPSQTPTKRRKIPPKSEVSNCFTYLWWKFFSKNPRDLPSLKLTWALKIGLLNRKVVFQPFIFRGENVSFREGISKKIHAGKSLVFQSYLVRIGVSLDPQNHLLRLGCHVSPKED